MTLLLLIAAGWVARGAFDAALYYWTVTALVRAGGVPVAGYRRRILRRAVTPGRSIDGAHLDAIDLRCQIRVDLEHADAL